MWLASLAASFRVDLAIVREARKIEERERAHRIDREWGNVSLTLVEKPKANNNPSSAFPTRIDHFHETIDDRENQRYQRVQRVVNCPFYRYTGFKRSGYKSILYNPFRYRVSREST